MNTATTKIPALPARADLAEWETRCRYNFVILSVLMGAAVMLIVVAPLLTKIPSVAAYFAEVETTRNPWPGRIALFWFSVIVASMLLSTVQIARLAHMTGRSWLFWGAFAFFIPGVGHLASYAALTAAGVSGGWLSRRYRWLTAVIIIVCLAEALSEMLGKFGQ